jgi:thiol-disulfide isomerase/thioredoxin
MKYVRFAIVIPSVFTAIALAAQTADLPLAGRLMVAQVRTIIAQWKALPAIDQPRVEYVERLKRVQRGASVKVFFGTWCENSKYEIPQFVRLVDTLGSDNPFDVEYFNVNQSITEPAAEIRTYNLDTHLPTFIVLRQGREVGRIVEQPARTLEGDLLRLLDGNAHGLLSSNETAIIYYLAPHRPAKGKPAN